MDQACDYAKSIEGPSSQIHNSSACNVCGNPDSHVRYNGVACKLVSSLNILNLGSAGDFRFNGREVQ